MSLEGQLSRGAGPAPSAGGAWRWALAPALGYLAAAAIVLALGFEAVSDDDYARALIAQRFARAPRLDPSGSSWLPFPFWVMGALMRAFGPSLAVARASALGWAAASGLLLWAAGRRAGLSPAAAALGALAPLTAPAIAPLAAAHVPELPTAALATYGVATACGGRGRALVGGGLALAAACLSRYEAWPLALYAALALGARARHERARGPAAIAASLAVAGPLAWLGWNHLAHGDALWFARRVAFYHANVARPPGAVAGALGGYPLALVREAPGLVLAAFVVLLAGREARRRWGLPLGAGLALLVALSAAEARGGAPTHHPERALLACWCLLGVAVAGEGARWLGAAAGGRSAERQGPGATGATEATGAPGKTSATGATGATGGVRAAREWGAAALVASVTVAGFAWRARAMADEVGPARADELALGRALAGRVEPGERVLLAPPSYAHLAAIAAFGRPDDVIARLPRAVDPRSTAPDPFADEASLARAIEGAGARWLLATGEQRRVAEASGLRGGPLVGSWWLY
ncbi:MAG TPA: glycosyltransferase family 39 protein, partial [Polyangiaceae bacterium]|nr:glycosyltransferase family 39 protein [Polyangiaceae bacterium]